jgi:diguanylate cyclase (GGDEF)-like protein/PAS domain S-box-containing protein
MSNQDSVPSVSGLQDVVQGKLELMSSLEPSVKCGCSLDDIVLDEKYLLFFSIVNQSSNAVVITDVNKNIVYVNQKFQQISGYSRGEVIGKNPRILTSKKTSPATYADMHKTLDAKQQWSGEFINRHKDGSEYIEQVVISPILNTRGDVVCYLAEKKDITLQKEAEARIQRLTHFDSLTGVPNRDYFLDQAGKMTDLLHSADNHFSLLFIDLNNFKALNDTYGHLHGDKALQIAAKRISGVIGPDDFLARVGGDEFVIVHNNATEGSTRKLARRLADDFSQPFLIDDKENQLGVSIGSACWPVDGTSIEQLLARADLAMYSAKTQDQSYCC